LVVGTGCVRQGARVVGAAGSVEGQTALASGIASWFQKGFNQVGNEFCVLGTP